MTDHRPLFPNLQRRPVPTVTNTAEFLRELDAAAQVIADVFERELAPIVDPVGTVRVILREWELVRPVQPQPDEGNHHAEPKITPNPAMDLGGVPDLR